MKACVQFNEKYYGGGAVDVSRDAARYRVLRAKMIQLYMPHDPTDAALDGLADDLLEQEFKQAMFQDFATKEPQE